MCKSLFNGDFDAHYPIQCRYFHLFFLLDNSIVFNCSTKATSSIYFTDIFIISNLFSSMRKEDFRAHVDRSYQIVKEKRSKLSQ